MTFPWFNAEMLGMYPDTDAEDFLDASCAMFHLCPTGQPEYGVSGVAATLSVLAQGGRIDAVTGYMRIIAEFAINLAFDAGFADHDGCILNSVITDKGLLWLRDAEVWDASRKEPVVH